MQRRRVSPALIIAVLFQLVGFCKSAHLRRGQSQFFNYNYAQHGQDWTAGSCAAREQQSPIDLPPNLPLKDGSFNYKYFPIDGPFEIMNTGHTLAADLAGMGFGGLTYQGDYYNLMNINVHSVSEHSWGGKKMPLEFHLVHKHYSKEALVIVAVAVKSPTPIPKLAPASLLQSSDRTNSSAPGYVEPYWGDDYFDDFVQTFLKVEPPGVNMKVQVPMDSRNAVSPGMLVGGGEFYEYAGSLTAPPCAELATWLVRKDAVIASDKQVRYLHDAIYKMTADFGNYRALMPLGGRQINLIKAKQDNPPTNLRPDFAVNGAPEQSDREYRAMKWSMDAMHIAKASTDYIKDLDTRLRKAARVHAEALAPRIAPLHVNASALESSLLSTTSAPAPMDMQNVAEEAARTLAEVTREQVDVATKEITIQAKQAAMKAALSAAGIVNTGVGEANTLANMVPAG